jgi:hypothetical protein
MYQIRWLPDGPTEEFAGSRGNYYEFAEADRLDLLSTPVWCHRCAQITHGEDLSTIEEIDKEIRDLTDPESELCRMTRHGLVEELCGKGDEFLRDRLAETRRRRRWREARKAPPKCILCGSTEIIVLPIGEAVPSPRGEGQVRVEIVGMCSTSFNEWFFTPEGDRIPRNTRPTYWSHPALDKPRQRRSLLKWLRSKTRRGDPGG